jgi:hypothetical protein
MLKSLRVPLTLLFVSLLVTVGTVSCTRENGKTVEKNAQREADSIASSATATAAQKQEARVPPSEPVQVRPNVVEAQVAEAPKVVAAQVAEVPKVVAAQVAAAEKSLGPRVEPTIGMSIAEVKASSWGEPMDIVEEEVVEGVIKTWRYGGNRTVQFDHMGLVTNVVR